MKRNLLFLVLIVVSAPVFSQNWAPINATEKFCYSSDEDLEIINNVIWVDSIQEMEDHEIYYFNKIVAPCDTCADTSYMLMNQSQFLLDYAKVYENGDWVFESNQQQFLIKTQTSQYEEWIFDYENGITAQEWMTYELSVLGELDSYKEILLSNGKRIFLSQNHGIIHWMGDYHLVGIEGRDLGIIVPTFRNMYQNWSEGDVFCYYVENTWADGQLNVDRSKIKYTIQNVERNNDSIVIETQFLKKREFIVDDNNGNYQYDESYFQGEQVHVFYPDLLTEAYPNEIIKDPCAFPGNIHGGEDTMILILEHHEWEGVKKTAKKGFNPSIGDFSIYSTFEFEELLIPTDWTNSQTSNYYNTPEYSQLFTFYESYLVGFEWEVVFDLVGVIDNGDTLGVIYDDDILLDAYQLETNSHMLLYPNPANDFLNIQYEGNNGCYKVFNLNGLPLKEGKLNQSESSISIKELPKGMYFIELNINGELSTQKWIKN